MVPDNLNTLNYPITTEEARLFWASRHKCNKMKSIIAFSLNLDNANDNLRRFGYSLQWRKKAIRAFGKYVNMPEMQGIPFSGLDVPWWVCMPVNGPVTTYVLRWMDRMNWLDEPREWSGPKGAYKKAKWKDRLKWKDDPKTWDTQKP